MASSRCSRTCLSKGSSPVLCLGSGWIGEGRGGDGGRRGGKRERREGGREERGEGGRRERESEKVKESRGVVNSGGGGKG